MEISEAQKQVDELIQRYGGYWKPLSMLARFTEETGELARAINIKHGEKRSKGDGDGRDIEEELADVLITTLAIANSEGIDLEKALSRKLGLDYEKCKGVYDDDNTNC